MKPVQAETLDLGRTDTLEEENRQVVGSSKDRRLKERRKGT